MTDRLKPENFLAFCVWAGSSIAAWLTTILALVAAVFAGLPPMVLIAPFVCATILSVTAANEIRKMSQPSASETAAIEAMIQRHVAETVSQFGSAIDRLEQLEDRHTRLANNTKRLTELVTQRHETTDQRMETLRQATLGYVERAAMIERALGIGTLGK